MKRNHTGSYASPQGRLHIPPQRSSLLTYVQQQRRNLPSLGDKLLASGTCPAQKDTVFGVSRRLERKRKERLNLVRHFWNKLVEVG